MWFASYLYEKGVITGDEFADAVRLQLETRPKIGDLAIRRRKMTLKQVMQVFYAQADDLECQFGELAVSLGFLTKQDVAELLVEQDRSVRPLGDILVEMGVMTHQQMVDELEEAHETLGYPEVPVLV